MLQQEIKSQNLEDRVQSIEQRLANLEVALASNFSRNGTSTQEEYLNSEASLIVESKSEEKSLESTIGRIGLAWLGNFVLMFAVIFFTEYLITLGHTALSAVTGALLVGVIFLIATYLKKSNQNLSFMLKTNSQIILFYEVMRMHFFSAAPLVHNNFTVLLALLLIIAYQVISSVRNKSQTLGIIAVTFALFTGVVSDSTHFLLTLMTATAVGALLYYLNYNWQFLLVISIILIYTVFFMWLYGNPVMGNKMEILSEHSYGFLYLFGSGACFSLLALTRKKDGSNDDFLVGSIILNGIFFSLLLSLISIKFFNRNYVQVFSLITFCCLCYSIVLKYASDWKFPSAFYALYGFVAMSISLYGIVGMPRFYLLLSVQSLVVVSMALWFRNRLMIVMNSLLFITILFVYHISSKSVNAVNISFALVPLISARIINWQKARLNIKTDLIRNLYLIVGFFMMLYTLYQGMPKQFVTLSWTVAALLYFLLSFLLSNIKYRYMALGTMICTAIYLFMVDLARIEIIYRVLALLFLAVVSIGISIYYSNRVKRVEKDG